jgi:hypothetical protein
MRTSTASPDLLRRVLEAAILAHSPLNCQPWRFEIADDALHLIHPHRTLLPLDIDEHATLIAFGGALENIAIAARHNGHRALVRYFPEPANSYFVAEIRFTPAVDASPDPLYDQIERRHSNPQPYLKQKLDADDIDVIDRIFAADRRFGLHLIEAPIKKRRLAELLIRAEKIVLGNEATREALLEGLAAGDLALEQMIGGRMRLLLLRTLLRRRWRHRVNPHLLLKTVSRNRILFHTSHLGAISVDECGPEAYLDAGRAIQRMWLDLSRRDVRLEALGDVIGLMMVYNWKVESFLTGRQNQALRDITETFNRLFELPFGRTALFLFRIGRATAADPPPRQPLRPLEHFAADGLREYLGHDQTG